jgi:hypothetical protein
VSFTNPTSTVGMQLLNLWLLIHQTIIYPKTIILILNDSENLKSHYIPCYVIFSHIRAATGYGLDSWGLFPDGSKIFFLLNIQTTQGPTVLPIQWVPWALSLGLK